MNNIILTIFPALSGESILVTCQGISRTTNILVDTGFPVTYEEHIIKRLELISKRQEQVDICVITHMHRDHIGGALLLLSQNGQANSPKVIKINDIWFNGVKHIYTGERVTSALNVIEKDLLEGIISKGNFDDNFDDENSDISAPEGLSLTNLMIENGYAWNKIFNGGAITNNTLPIININDVEFTIISPTAEGLRKADRYLVNELNKLKSDFRISQEKILDQALEYLLSQEIPDDAAKCEDISDKDLTIEELLDIPFVEDTSLVNLSSISFILRYGGKRILYLSDAHPTVIKDSLLRYVEQTGNDLFFDVIKIPHHGSSSNLSKDLLELIDARVFIFCTNGQRHNHPDAVTIARIIARESLEKRILLFNYPVESVKAFIKEEWFYTYNYEIIINNDNAPIDWRV